MLVVIHHGEIESRVLGPLVSSGPSPLSQLGIQDIGLTGSLEEGICMPDYSLKEQIAAPFVERSYSRMVENVSDYAVFMLDSAGVIQTWNPAAHALKGYLKDEVIGRKFSMFYTDEDQRRHHPAHNLADAAEHDTFQETAWRKRKDGSQFWALVEITAIRNDANKLEGFRNVTRDLTNLKQLQPNVEAEKARWESMLGVIADGVIATDNAGLVEYMNYQAQRFVGWSQEDAQGLPIDQVFDIVQLDAYSVEEARLTQGEMRGTSARTTQILRARDGVRHVIEACRSEIPGRGGQLSGTVILFHDVCERQRMEAALRETDRRKDEFVTMLAHELRNPLAPVSMAAELLASGKLDSDTAKKASQVIIRQVKHMTALVDDLLDLSCVSRGQITLRIAPLDMKIVVDTAVEQVRSLIENRRHKLVIVQTADTACVKGDNKRLVQVVANLLNNAAKYTPPGGTISVEISVADSGVCIEVADDGIGIDPASHESIFNLFEQANNAGENSPGGLGIGLALVRNLTHLHGGTAKCHSEGLGHGSRFTIRIPRLAPSDAVSLKGSTDRVLAMPLAMPSWKPTDSRCTHGAPPQ